MTAYYRRGTWAVRWLVDGPADPFAPTLTELDDGVDLGPQLAALDGFTLKTGFIGVALANTAVVTQIGGQVKAEGGSLTFNERLNRAAETPSTYDPALAALGTRGATGTLVIAPYGAEAGNDCEVWPCRVASFSRSFDMGNAPAQWVVELACTGEPTQHATIAAGAYLLWSDDTPVLWDDDTPVEYAA